VITEAIIIGLACDMGTDSLANASRVLHPASSLIREVRHDGESIDSIWALLLSGHCIHVTETKLVAD
jgi:hypothetical protein